MSFASSIWKSSVYLVLLLYKVQVYKMRFKIMFTNMIRVNILWKHLLFHYLE